jgi:hypothetical protein
VINACLKRPITKRRGWPAKVISIEPGIPG